MVRLKLDPVVVQCVTALAVQADAEGYPLPSAGVEYMVAAIRSMLLASELVAHHRGRQLTMEEFNEYLPALTRRAQLDSTQQNLIREHVYQAIRASKIARGVPK